ncbi:elongation factor G [bacterium]|nr:elongation factor G [bacterium]
MVAYTGTQLRNVCIAGHGTSGKTTLVESMMLHAGAINRQGAVEDGSTVSDFTEEEKNRGISVSLSVNSVDHKSHLLTFLDTPGYFDFAGEVASAIPFCETTLLTVRGSAGLDVGTENAFRLAKKHNRSVAFFITEMDRESINLEKIMDGIQRDLGIQLAPITYPAKTGQDIATIIDVLRRKRISYADNKITGEIELDGEYAEKAQEWKEKLMEAIAESDEALMEKYFEVGELTDDEINNGLKSAMIAGTVYPVFFGAPNKGIGTDAILTAAIDFFPSPAEQPAVFDDGENVVEADESADIQGVLIKVNSIPQFGEVYICKLLQGTMNEGDDVYNGTTMNNEKFGQIFAIRGKDREQISSVVAGQIFGAVKLKHSKTGDKLVKDKAADAFPYTYIKWPTPIVRGAFSGESKEDTDKVATSLKKVQVEDASYKFFSDPELHQLFVDGLGELHLDVIAKKIKHQYGISVNITEPRVPYRETIKGRAEVRYRHKKQSGGSGEFGEVNIVLEPSEGEFEFVNSIVGGVISGKYIPAVEKGIREVMVEGVVAGCRFINCRVTLNDGKEHPVDSKEVAFKKAAAQAFKEAVKQAIPTLLEPIYDVSIKVPEEYAGSVMGDISSRRGKPLGMDSEGKYTIVKAKVPLKELHGYSTQLRSMTNGRGTYGMEFSHYEQVAGDIQKKIIEEYERSKEQ